MSVRRLRRPSDPMLLLVLLALAAPWPARAVPSFARQTGLACSSCHTVFPQLNALGRTFKLRGYTLAPQPENPSKQLQESEFAPISVMFQASHSAWSAKLPDSTSNDTRLPQEISLFYAGRISDHMGAFLQVTYDGAEDHFAMDNADVRWIHQGKEKLADLTYGLTLNNNPTVEDLWNSTPAWGYPFSESGSAPSPAASTLLEGGLEQQVAGLGAYASWNNKLYGDVTLYRESKLGGAVPPDSTSENVVDGVAPYARVAFSHGWRNNDLMIGALGMTADVLPGAGEPLTGPSNRFKDVGVDSQLLHYAGNSILELHGRWIDEKQTWNAGFASGSTARLEDRIVSERLDATYLYDRRIGGTVGWFSTTGTRDEGLYAPNPVDGSRTGSPDSRGLVFEADYYPWYNTRLSAQYKVYEKFNGASTNYDGFGRSASNNDTLYLNVWLMF